MNLDDIDQELSACQWCVLFTGVFDDSLAQSTVGSSSVGWFGCSYAKNAVMQCVRIYLVCTFSEFGRRTGGSVPKLKKILVKIEKKLSQTN